MSQFDRPLVRQISDEAQAALEAVAASLAPESQAS